MMDSYLTLGTESEARFTVQKSVFIGHASPCVSEEEALALIRRLSEETKDASHHCYAYIIGTNEGIMRYSDDGEPGGTAGLPMISLIRAEKVVNCCVVVTRYFGGVLLGTGGLVRAYTQGCRIALDAAGIVRMERTAHDLCEVPYACWDRVRYTLMHVPAKITDISYGASVTFTLLTRKKDRTAVLDDLSAATGRQFVYLEDEEQFEAWEI